MKRLSLSWREWLREGVHLMEGTHPEPQWQGRRWYREAGDIFEECAGQKEDVALRAEAAFLRAQCAHCQGDFRLVDWWFQYGRAVLDSPDIFPDKRAESYLLQGTLLESQGQVREALAAMEDAWHVPPDSAALRGKIASAVALLFMHHGELLGFTVRGKVFPALAWGERAVQQFSSLPEPSPGDLWSLVAASTLAGCLSQNCHGYSAPDAKEHFRFAEVLLKTSVRDPRLRATFWSTRFWVALGCGHLIDACKFFLRSLPPRLARWCRKQRA